MGERIHGLGHFDIVPALNTAEQQYLIAYAESWTLVEADPYHVDDHPVLARQLVSDTSEGEQPVAIRHDPVSWAPDFSGESLHPQDQDGIRHPLQSLQHLLDHFLTPDAARRHVDDPRFEWFTFDHELHGAVALESNYTGELSLVTVENGMVRSRVVSECGRCAYGESGQNCLGSAALNSPSDVWAVPTFP